MGDAVYDNNKLQQPRIRLRQRRQIISMSESNKIFNIHTEYKL